MRVKFFYLVFCPLLLSACASAAAPTPTLLPSPTATASHRPSATATATQTPTDTAIPTSAVCSPLLDHELASLGNYLTQPLILPLGENQEKGHHGVDFAYYRRDDVGGHIEGTPIQSVLDGVVAGLGYATVYGHYIIIETPFERLPPPAIVDYELQPGQSLYLLYAHLQDGAPFAVGDAVVCSSVLGLVGASGQEFFVVEPHLHFEVRSGASGQRFGPMNFYTTQATAAENQEYIRWRSSGDFALLDPLVLLGIAP